MSERIFPIGDSPQFNQNPSSGSDNLNLVRLTGPSGREVPVLPIQIDDPAIIERAMNPDIFGSDGPGKLAANLAGPGAGDTADGSQLTMSNLFDHTAGSVLAQNQDVFDFSPAKQNSGSAASKSDFDFDL